MPDDPTSPSRAPAADGSRTPVTVLAVDDQRIFRRAIASLIDATPEFEQVGEATSGAEALELAAELHPDLVLLDVRMPEMDGIETARRLHEADARIAIVLTSLDEVPELAAARGATGACAYVRKQDLSTRKLHELWASLVSPPG
ncbi:MAG: response regulator transcription factor [Actinobacteria bacterium]|nr:response regulator transcription factor [Actinomycetota bacterium]